MPDTNNSSRITYDDQYKEFRDQGMNKHQAAYTANASEEASIKSKPHCKFKKWTSAELYQKAIEIARTADRTSLKRSS